MAPPKKMTLQEFFTDESFGGSWADDDIDIASISVPIEKNKHYPSYSNDPFGNSSSSNYNNYNRGSMHQEFGAPYIVKLLNLPLKCDNAFIEDLFKSRYTTFVKFKIVVDPSSNVLETHIIRKIAFVELHSSQDLQKVLKWQDLYYKASRRVIVELADFEDFQHCISFNQEHEKEIYEIEHEFFSGKHHQLPQQQFHHQPQSHQKPFQYLSQTQSHHQPNKSLDHAAWPSHVAPSSSIQSSLGMSIKKSTIKASPETTTSTSAMVPPKPKPNPFGAAKPVDIVAKSHEIDKKLITVNQTTIRTMGSSDNHSKSSLNQKKSSNIESQDNNESRGISHSESRRPSFNILRRPSISTFKEVAHEKNGKSDIIPSNEIPTDNNLSLAELLSSKHEPGSESASRKGTPKPNKVIATKPTVLKPVILKKKSPNQPRVDLTTKESEVVPESTIDVSKSNDKENKPDLGDISKEINESLPKTELSDNKVKTKKDTKEKPSDSLLKDKASRSKTDRPNFKKHLSELVKKPHTSKENILSNHPRGNNNKTSNSKLQVKENKNSIEDRKKPNKNNGKFLNTKIHDIGESLDIPVKLEKSLELNDETKLKPKPLIKGKNATFEKSSKRDLNNSTIPKMDENITKVSPRNFKSDSSKKKFREVVQLENNVSKEQSPNEKKFDAKKRVRKPSTPNESSRVDKSSKGSNPFKSKDQSEINMEKTEDKSGDQYSDQKSSSPSNESNGSISQKSKSNEQRGTESKASTNVEKTEGEPIRSFSRGSLRGGRGRSRGRGAERGRGRGRGNFNLHYIRNKEGDANTYPKS